MLPVEFLFCGIVKVKGNTLYWDNTKNTLSPKKTPTTVPVRFKLNGNPNYMSLTRISKECVGIQISDGSQTQFIFVKGEEKTRCLLNVGIRNPQQGWRTFQIELLSEHNKELNRLYKPMSAFLTQLMNQSTELRKPFRSWLRSGNEVFIFDCEFSRHRDKVYHYHIETENERHPAILGIPLRRLFKKIKSIKDKRLTYEFSNS